MTSNADAPSKPSSLLRVLLCRFNLHQMGAASRHGKRRAISAVHDLQPRPFLGGGNSLPM